MEMKTIIVGTLIRLMKRKNPAAAAMKHIHGGGETILIARDPGNIIVDILCVRKFTDITTVKVTILDVIMT